MELERGFEVLKLGVVLEEVCLLLMIPELVEEIFENIDEDNFPEVEDT